jgi:hypothetical protein
VAMDLDAPYYPLSNGTAVIKINVTTASIKYFIPFHHLLHDI